MTPLAQEEVPDFVCDDCSHDKCGVKPLRPSKFDDLVVKQIGGSAAFARRSGRGPHQELRRGVACHSDMGLDE